MNHTLPGSKNMKPHKIYPCIRGTRRLASFLSLGWVILSAQILSSAVFPTVPDGTTTTVQDRDQMLSQLGITFPSLPPKLQDPHAPANSYPSDAANPEGNWTDASNHTVQRTDFGLWNNYSNTDLSLIGQYTPIDLLVMNKDRFSFGYGFHGWHQPRRIKTATEWWTKRRPEVFRAVQEELYGSIPDRSLWPAIIWSISDQTTGIDGGIAYTQRVITGTIDTLSFPALRNVPKIKGYLRLPANATGPVPAFVVFSAFGAGYGYGDFNTYFLSGPWASAGPQGYGVCIYDESVLQPDSGGANLSSYLIGLFSKGNWRKPGDWGTLAAWSWGASRLVDYFETTTDVDATKLGIEGHSRYGKAAIVAAAYDQRIQIAWPSSSGSLGAKMIRRHWGQNLENSSWDQEYHWMAGNFYKWMGPLFPGQYMPRRVELMSVDGHSLISLVSPRPVFLSAGTTNGAPVGDSWTDPLGIYLAGMGASPVYELLGGKGLIVPDPLDAEDGTPRIDVAYTEGDIAFRHHHEGHTDAPDWPYFVQFAKLYFDDRRPVITTGQSLDLAKSHCGVLGSVKATDADAADKLGNWQLTGGDGASIFEIDSKTGIISIEKWWQIDFRKDSYKLWVTVSDGILTSVPREVTVTLPDRIRLCQFGRWQWVSKAVVPSLLRGGYVIGESDGPGWPRFHNDD